MITGKYLENPALYSPDELERLDNHIEKYFGKATTVVHEFFSEDIHVDVSIIPPHEEHNYYTLVTTGMGAFSMKIPSEYQEDGLPSRIELMMCLPPEWNPESKESQENWPVELLRYLARFPIIESTWLGYGHSIQNGTPYADNTLLAGCVLLGVQDAPEGAAVCKLSDGSWVGFYQVIQRTTQEPSALRICSKKAFVVQIPLFCKRLGGSFTRMNSCHVWRPVGALMKKEH